MTTSAPVPPVLLRDRDRAWTCERPSPDALAFHRGLAEYAATPLTELPELARELGVGRVLAKDESSRLGLPAFKALGASWAVHRALASLGASEAEAGETTVTTATDGNHGRAVARYARRAGHRARVWIPEGVHPDAVRAVQDEGGEVTMVAGSYDDAVAAARDAADAPRHVLVQDMAWEGYTEVPGHIVEGYATLFAEIDEQLGGTPDLVLVPTGVGSLLQAALAHYRGAEAAVGDTGSGTAVGAAGDAAGGTAGDTDGGTADGAAGDIAGGAAGGQAATAVVSVEAAAAPCIAASLRAGRPTTVPQGPTVMSGLACGTPSMTAWPYVERGLDAAVVVGEDDDIAAAHDLADLGVAAGPCGAAGLAGLRLLLAEPGARDRLGLGPDATVVLVVTEGSAANPVPPRRD